jgi:hypothetical protein
VDPSEPWRHSFILRIWIERHEAVPGRVEWRGQIVHLPERTTVAIGELDDLGYVVAPYLEAMGVRLGRWWQLKRWGRRRWLAADRWRRAARSCLRAWPRD